VARERAWLGDQFRPEKKKTITPAHGIAKARKGEGVQRGYPRPGECAVEASSGEGAGALAIGYWESGRHVAPGLPLGSVTVCRC